MIAPGGNPTQDTQHGLRRDVGMVGAVSLGLGSMIGTGAFVAIGLASGLAGSWTSAAILVAAGLAMCSALSAAQLASAHPVSGGTYEYAARLIGPRSGFCAGWLFITAKCASAAAAAIGAASYLLESLAVDGHVARVGVALLLVGALTLLTLGGIKRSAVANSIIVAITLAALLVFVGATVLAEPLKPPPAEPSRNAGAIGALQAVAIVFVAFTGYGRVATLGEEVRDPRRTIPRAVVITVLVTAALYLAIVFSAGRVAGTAEFARLSAETGAPLERIASSTSGRAIGAVIAVGALTAMVGVLLNLILGVSRVILAMGRRGDAPGAVARVSARGVPVVATIVTAALIGVFTATVDLTQAWQVSAASVLAYYAITNATALRLSAEQRFLPRWISWCGLLACVGAAAFTPWWAVLLVAAIVVIGLCGRALLRRSPA